MDGFEDMHVIVTGAAGFLGSHLVDALMASGCRVVGIDNLSSGTLGNLRTWLDHPSLSFIREDLKHESDWCLAFKGADVVFHFAANPEVRISSARPRVHFDENVVATFNVLEAARRSDVDILVFASSSTVYGDPEVVPMPEDHPKRPVSIYGASHHPIYSGAHGLTSDSLSLPAGSHLNLHRPLPNDSTTNSSSSANMSFIRGSSARGDMTMSVATAL